MARYGKTAQKKVEKVMRERKRGTLRSGGSGKKVTSRKQAIAIGLSQARREGKKVPSKRSSGGTKKKTRSSGGRQKATSRRRTTSGGRKKATSRRRTSG